MQSVGKAILAIVGLLLVLVIAGGVFCIGTFNSIAAQFNTIEQKAADIDAQLQRRIDLIPNLVEVAKQYAQHETDVFDSVTTARENLVAAATMSEKADADAQLTSALGGIVAIAEAYPELASSTVYIDLMDELAGAENRISYARTEYNEAVGKYNTSIAQFPGMLIAGIFNFEKATYFEATADASAPITVDMSLS